MSGMMKAAFLPGNSDVEIREVSIPEPGHGEVLLQVKASTICGSDIRCIYHEHLGKALKDTRESLPGTSPPG
jgi:threonine dehydrogenase-like Zn-dependent dehydrogenase